jgi:hypothetical protein
MAQDDTIQDIIDRISSARDRFVNAGDDKGVLDAEQALSDLKNLDPGQLPTAHDVEEYFNGRAAIRVNNAKGPLAGNASARKQAVSDDDSIGDSSDDS